MSFPQIVSREEWTSARESLLQEEKALTRARDQLSAARRAMPVVPVEKEYVFASPTGEVTLLELFQGRRQLLVRHFMFDPKAEEGCVGCSMQADNVGDLSHMHARDTSFVMIARAPLEKIEQFKARMGWAHIPWVSSYGSDFNYDFNVTMEKGELPAVSSFIRDGEQIFHASSVFDRGGEVFINTYNYLDVTPLGRQEEELAHPWDWWRHHDRYDAEQAANPGENWWTGVNKFEVRQVRHDSPAAQQQAEAGTQ
ncbi:DUF899 domain-containing protein [Micromonospora rubida]|uniref:DUF899 domain-containing protein n=1 Tax=Micromonospora rubida TaxID=2697657 RepID=A0ABW7SSP1_9ACTN